MGDRPMPQRPTNMNYGTASPYYAGGNAFQAGAPAQQHVARGGVQPRPSPTSADPIDWQMFPGRPVGQRPADQFRPVSGGPMLADNMGPRPGPGNPFTSDYTRPSGAMHTN